MPRVGEAFAKTFSSLRNYNYRAYFVAQAVSMSGTWMQTVAQSWLVLQLTHSGFMVGALVAFQTIPVLVFGPFAGVIVDRFDKWRILWVTQVISGLQALALGLLVLSGADRLWMVFALAFLLGLINMVDNPTRQTFVLEMVGRKDLTNAVSLNSVLINTARITGPAIAGVLIATVGTGMCFVINAGSFVAVLVALGVMRRDQLVRTALVARAKGQLREGFRYVAQTPVLRDVLIMMGIAGCLSYEWQVSLPLVAERVLHGNAGTYGTLTASMGVGAVIGGLIVAGRNRGGRRKVAMAGVLFGAFMALAAIAPNVWTEELAMLLVGGGSITFMTRGNAILQLEARPDMRGRVMSLWSVAFMGSTPIGGPVIGWVGDEFGARSTLGVGAAAALVAAGFVLVAMHRRRARQEDATTEQADTPVGTLQPGGLPTH